MNIRTTLAAAARPTAIVAICLVVGAAAGWTVVETNAAIETRVQREVSGRMTEEVPPLVDARLIECRTAIDRAEDSIFAYFDGLRAERETEVSEETRAARGWNESKAYDLYVKARDVCRKDAQKTRAG